MKLAATLSSVHSYLKIVTTPSIICVYVCVHVCISCKCTLCIQQLVHRMVTLKMVNILSNYNFKHNFIAMQKRLINFHINAYVGLLQNGHDYALTYPIFPVFMKGLFCFTSSKVETSIIRERSR